MEIETIRQAVTDAKEALRAAEHARDAWEIDTDSREVVEMYEEMLDSDGDVTVCGMAFAPSDILKSCDETAYRCGMNDYADSLDKEDFPEYKELCAAVEEAESALSDAEDDLEAAEDAEAELEDEE